jgi:dihydroorotate dehydrogenase electron transfer subunit
MQLMKKILSDFTVSENIHLNDHYILLKLTQEAPLPDMLPGQFVEVRIDHTPEVMLRRPISINFVDREHNMLWLLVHLIGKGTFHLATLVAGDKLNLLLPLGNSFSLPASDASKGRMLLVGGGAGIAPMLMLGKLLADNGYRPTFLLGARSKEDLFELEEFASYGDVCLSTEDGSLGEKGFVTQHSILNKVSFDRIYSCGPKPMMMAVARYATAHGIDCEVSLENKMACGLGACLCCVEDTKEGNQCVCKEGPVFNINQLKWQI